MQLQHPDSTSEWSLSTYFCWWGRAASFPLPFIFNRKPGESQSYWLPSTPPQGMASWSKPQVPLTETSPRHKCGNEPEVRLSNHAQRQSRSDVSHLADSVVGCMSAEYWGSLSSWQTAFTVSVLTPREQEQNSREQTDALLINHANNPQCQQVQWGWKAFVLPSSSSGTVWQQSKGPSPSAWNKQEKSISHMGHGERSSLWSHKEASSRTESSQSWRSCVLTTKPPFLSEAQVRIRQSHMAVFQGYWLHERHSCPSFPHSSNRPWALNSAHGNQKLMIFRLQSISYRTDTLF